MSRKRHNINIPGVMLDTIRDSNNYENDERFTKRRKIKGKGKGQSVLSRKEARKQQRMEKKNHKVEAKMEHKAQLKSKNDNKLHPKPENKPKVVKPTKHVHIQESKSETDNRKKEKNKKRVSFSDHDDIREIPARNSLDANIPDIDLHFEQWEKEFMSDDGDTDEDESDDIDNFQDEEEENDAHNLIERLKHLKQVQRGEYPDDNLDSDAYDEEEEANENLPDDLDEDQKDVMAQLAKLKGKKGNNKKAANFRIVKEDDLKDDSLSEEEEDGESELDEEQLKVMSQLKSLKGKSKDSDIRIVKEDDLNDDSLSEEEEDEESELDEEQLNVMDQLKSLKGKSKDSAIRIIKEDELEDDASSLDEFASSEEEEDDDEEEHSDLNLDELDDEQKDIIKQLASLKAKKRNTPKKSDNYRVVKEDDLSDLDDDEADDNSVNISDSESEDDMSALGSDELDEEQSSVMKRLASLKKNKKNLKPSEIKIVKEDELDDDSMSSQDELQESEESEESEVFDSPSMFHYNDNNDMEYYAKKLGLNSKKKIQRIDDNDIVGGLFEGLDFMDRYDDPAYSKEENSTITKKDKSNKKINKEDEKGKLVSAHDRELLQKDKEDINYYAKKLGINPKKGITKQDDDDIIGGLFDGIKLDFSDENDSDYDQGNKDEEELEESADEARTRTVENGDDEVNSDDFDDDDDLDDDDKALLKEMYGLESSDSDSDSSFDSDESDDTQPRVKENPYIAPIQIDQSSTPGSKYIPPALRRKMAMDEDKGDSEEIKKLMRLVKGPFNKLSEPNIHSVVSDLNNLYNDNPRQFVNEAILKVILQSVAIPTPMLESFLVLYASAIVAIYKLQGVEFGAFIIQKLVEEFEKDIESESRARQEIINLTGLLGYLYTLNLVTATLVYDIIKVKLIKNTSELKTDILLKLIRSCGSKLRSDDSTALNSIILELTKSVKENEKLGIKTSTRSRFLIDTITDLKNNRLKNSENENTTLMVNRLKKQLGSINGGRNFEPIKVNLDDIENIEARGKWWLVGSAWKGKSMDDENHRDSSELIGNDDTEANVNSDLYNHEDELLGGLDVNWMELAKQCRMNTDIRRAIFVSIMSAEDFMDAFMKLEKLNLKNSQKKEIPNILMHCATMEPNYNPYYSFLAKKLSNDHSMRRSFQLNLWDFIKELDDEESSTTILADADDDQRLWKLLNMGRFFGFLIGEGSLSLNILRVVNFLTASSDVKIFLEIMIITLLDTVGKRSEVKTSNNKIEFTGKIIAEIVSKCEEQPLLIKGLQYFINSKVRRSKFIKGKKQRARIEWGIDTMSEMLSEVLKNKK